jgi:hypothetical protein
MDYMSGLPSTKRGNDCVFVVVDRFSKMVILVAWKKSITAEATAKLFFERVWVHFGIPQTIVSYRDSRFLSTFWSSLWSLLDTKLTKSTTLLDTPTTLRGGVNECGALFPKTSLLQKNSSISIQHLFITHCCHL